MKCHEATELISEYIDGEISAKHEQELLKHLAECSKCQQELEQFKLVRDTLKNLPKEAMPDEQVQELMIRIDDELKTGDKVIVIPRKRNFRLLVAAAMGFIFILIVSFPVYNLWNKNENLNFRATQNADIREEKAVESGIEKSAQPSQPESEQDSPELTEESESILGKNQKILPANPVVTVSKIKINPDKPFDHVNNEKISENFSKSYNASEITDFKEDIVNSMYQQAAAQKQSRTKFQKCLFKPENSLPELWLPALADRVEYKGETAWLIVYTVSEDNYLGILDKRYLYIISLENFEIVAEAKNDIFSK